jgi:hydroxymethylpyrimidine kinase/phosphomethylpyrimidine kinase
MSETNQRPVVLAIAGSDSGGGAGIQADLKAITAMGGWAATAITCLTAQNLSGVRSLQPAEPSILADQIDAVCEGFEVRAIKTGMLHSSPLIRVVVDRLLRHRDVQLVVDPVMVASSGAKLLEDDAIATLRDELLPMATLVTPNLHEASLLTGAPVRDRDSMADAATAIHRMGPGAVLVKGGHLEGDSVDVLFDGDIVRHFHARRLETGSAGHGTGCTLASAIATGLAHGLDLADAVATAKRRLTEALRDAADLGGGVEALDLFAAAPGHGVVRRI